MPHIWVPAKTQNKRRDQMRKSQGKTLGMGICAWLCMIFEANEDLPKSKKLTDWMIAEMLAQEYPTRPIARKILSPGMPTVNSLRGRYNRGEFYTPQVISFRYDEAGEKVNGRTGATPLTQAQISSILALHERETPCL